MIFKLRIIFWNNYSPRLVYIFRFHTKACLTPVSISFSTTVEIVEEFSAILVRIIRCLFLLLPNQYEFATLATRLFCKDTRGDIPRCYQSAHPLWSMRKLNPPATWTSMEHRVPRRDNFSSNKLRDKRPLKTRPHKFCGKALWFGHNLSKWN